MGVLGLALTLGGFLLIRVAITKQVPGASSGGTPSNPSTTPAPAPAKPNTFGLPIDPWHL